ncbi:dethiobiotin synthase [Bordetella parapertussis]|uniref:ATP-dependent dethiobiotin synthetase BioD n=1 Tax=Bordetella parapertussis (strain Bpp5) TaxID=1208660 RepID=K0M9K5_BORPB|nr:dethiobiotin synthase [Bordetella parapertussis]CCJ50420.1 putative biotin synthesis protein [Bordetella parapertussis Bpp5]
MSTRSTPTIGQRFDRAAARYETHAEVQRHAAEQLAERIAALPLPAEPRILEIGCGTGLLTRALARRLGRADWTITDIAPAMLAAQQAGPPPAGRVRHQLVDGEHPAGLPGGYDLICSSLAVQWFGDLDAGLARLAGLLAPGGLLAIATLAEHTFSEWRAAHQAHGLHAATPAYPPAERIGRTLAGLRGGITREAYRQRHPDALHFVRSLKAIGASAPAAGHAPLSPAAFRRVLAQFDRQGNHVTYDLAYGLWRKQAPGVFVTGTDTGVGKTLASAILARAWRAHYWKPLQTGVAEEPGDTETVAALAGLEPARLHPPAHVLQAPLSPWAAAPLEGVTLDAAAIAPPQVDGPLVVEGAGGLYVPIDERHMMIDLMARLGMPVVLAARSGLGTINHTLLSLHALRERRLPVLGVIMLGEPSAGNRHAIEHFGSVPVLAQIPRLARVDAEAVEAWAARIPPLADCLARRWPDTQETPACRP